MRVCDASTSISAEFGGIRDSCLDIYHLIINHDGSLISTFLSCMAESYNFLLK